MEENTPTQNTPTQNTTPQQAQITINPENSQANQAKSFSIFSGNKGLLIAMVIVVALTIVGISALMGFNASNQYQGMIKKVQEETKILEAKIEK